VETGRAARPGREVPAKERRDTVGRLTGLTHDLPAVTTLATEALNTALSITGADLGFVQLVDGPSRGLATVARTGFDAEVAAHFDTSGADASTSSGRALLRRTQVVIGDVDLDPDFRPHRGIAAVAGFRAVQSTPLVTSDDRIVGVVSTHFRRPHRPSAGQLRSLVSSGRLAGAALAELADLHTTVTQLQHALMSRLVIEQAKGVISATHRIDLDRSFQLLRGYARSHRARIHDVADAVVNSGLRL
jgi:GAF domain-containing protein